MNLEIHPNADAANAAAADRLADWLSRATTRNLMVAAGNTPIDLYGRIARRGLSMPQLRVFTLDEYVGVPAEDPRNCTNLLRRAVATAWGIPPTRFFTVSPHPEQAAASIARHERRIADAGGLDVIVLGLGQNGHLGFNEPGSDEASVGRVVELEASSVEANRKWFGGEHAPSRGVTVGLRTVLATRRVMVLALGPHKAAAVKAMVEGPRQAACPASFLQGHPQTWVFLDEAAASSLKARRSPGLV